MKMAKQRCNHCGGLMRKYMEGSPTCLNCGRYENHICKDCCSDKLLKLNKSKKAKSLAA